MSRSHHKQEYSPLLKPGFHEIELAELRALCVQAFPNSPRRAEIMAGFEAIYEALREVGIHGEIWIDGSFLTKKEEPEDLDFVAMLPSALYDSGAQRQRELIDWLIDSKDDPKLSFLCHSHVELMYPPDSPLYVLTVNTRRHWNENVFGYSVATRTPKGIALLKLQPPQSVPAMKQPAVVEEGAKA